MAERHQIPVASPSESNVGLLLQEPGDFSWNHDGTGRRILLRCGSVHGIQCALSRLCNPDTRGQAGRPRRRDQEQSRYLASTVIGDRPVDTITSADVLAVLTPIRLEKPETARRLTQRIKAVLAWATAAGYRSPELANPVDGVVRVLPRHTRATSGSIRRCPMGRSRHSSSRCGRPTRVRNGRGHVPASIDRYTNKGSAPGVTSSAVGPVIGSLERSKE